MKDKVVEQLCLPPGAYVLDAGCGVGHVAIHLAKAHKLRIQGIDIIKHHLDKAKRNTKRSGLLDNQIEVRKMD